jgi:hypothetical protein
MLLQRFARKKCFFSSEPSESILEEADNFWKVGLVKYSYCENRCTVQYFLIMLFFIVFAVI